MRIWIYPERAGIPELGRDSHSSYGSSGEISIPQSGVNRDHRNVPHKSNHSYVSTPDSSGLWGLPNRTPLRSDQPFPKWPTSPSDTLICAAPAHLRTPTDMHANFPYFINTFHILHTEHFQYMKITISNKLWLGDLTNINNTLYRLWIPNTSVSFKIAEKTSCPMSPLEAATGKGGNHS